MGHRILSRACLCTIIIASLCPIHAQQPPPDEQDNGEQARPEQSVARISVLNGDVSVRRGDSGDVVAAAVNAPLVVNDALLTASTSRAEIQFDATNFLRLGSGSEVRMADLQYGRYQIQLALGTITYRVLRAPMPQVEIQTPVLAVRPLAPGIYRVTVREDGSVEIVSRQGEAEVASQAGTQRVRTGTMMMVRGPANDPEYQMVQAPGLDDWDRWNDIRDREMSRPQPSSRYLSPDVYGTENLDNYGRWVQDPQYGNVWAPNEPQGWAPYQVGQWVWEDYYGWTWVSTDPWGWAPYHYGRWFQGTAGWCWYPGPVYGHHYWSPALVAFFGFGRGVGLGFGFGFGNIGWVPLAPFEVFHPWWGRGYYGGRGFNNTIVNNVNIVNTYRNARAYNGVTTVNANAFGRQGGRFASMSGSQIRDAGLVRGALPVVPDRTSLRLSNRTVNSSAFPQARAQQFYSRSGTSTGSARIPFEQQRSMMQQATRPGFSQQGVQGGTVQAQHGWQRFGEPVHNSTSQTQSFGSFGGGRAAGSTYTQSRGTSSYYSAPRYEAPARGTYSGGYGQAVRINPPIVHSYNNSGSFGGGRNSYGGGGAPSYRPSAPSRQSAPSYHPSGGGGGRSSGGGGGHGGGGSHGGRR